MFKSKDHGNSQTRLVRHKSTAKKTYFMVRRKSLKNTPITFPKEVKGSDKELINKKKIEEKKIEEKKIQRSSSKGEKQSNQLPSVVPTNDKVNQENAVQPSKLLGKPPINHDQKRSRQQNERLSKLNRRCTSKDNGNQVVEQVAVNKLLLVPSSDKSGVHNEMKLQDTNLEANDNKVSREELKICKVNGLIIRTDSKKSIGSNSSFKELSNMGIERKEISNLDINSKELPDTNDNNTKDDKSNENETVKKIVVINNKTIAKKDNKEMNVVNKEEEYKIGKSIGRGAYSVVKDAIHIATNTQVAIKIYDREKFTEPRRKRRVSQEIEILKNLNHKSIVKFFDYFESEKYLYLVMEMVEGELLYDYLKFKRNKRIPEEEALKILKEMTIGIEYCHSKRVFHRDIKTDNLILQKSGTVKIIDFGFSIHNPKNLKLKIHCGTLSFMSPELIGKEDYYGGPVDVWALGVVFYMMLFGHCPFVGEKNKELKKNIKEAVLRFDEDVNISDKSKQILTKIFEPNPSKRITSKQLLNLLVN